MNDLKNVVYVLAAASEVTKKNCARWYSNMWCARWYSNMWTTCTCVEP